MTLFILTLMITLANAQHGFIAEVADGMYEYHQWIPDDDLDENQTYALFLLSTSLLLLVFGTLFLAKALDVCHDDNDW
jgi:hypothetical protein